MGFIEDLKLEGDGAFHVIAEIGHNHQGSLDKCMALFDAAKAAGAHSVKLQKRDNKSLYTPAVFNETYNSTNAYADTYGAHREALEFGKDEYYTLKQYAESIDIMFWSTAFDIPSVDFLMDVGVPAIKIASGDIRSHHLQDYAASTGLPIVFSTGGATMLQVQAAHDVVAARTSEFSILQCIASYPAPFDQLNLNVIPSYVQHFPDAVIGYSGHENGIAMSNVAYVLGARVIEKHFTLDRTMKGTDHAFSLEPEGMRKLVRDLERTRQALGSSVKEPLDLELPAVTKMGKKAVAARALKCGDILHLTDIEFRSPGNGIAPDEAPLLYGRVLARDIDRYEDLQFADFISAD